MRLLEEGLEYRSWPSRKLLHYDDLERMEATAVHAYGRRFRLRSDVAPLVARELQEPALPADLPAARTWWSERMSRPHGPRRAALRLLELATQLGTSDLHLEAEPDGWTVRLRIAGELCVLGRASKERGGRLVAAFKGLSGALPYRSDILQEGRVPRAGARADVRTSFAPTAMGERAVLRLFGEFRELDALGVPEAVRHAFEAALSSRTGLLLVAGATGAGKTTTLYAALSHLARHRPGAHLSLEDPVEQRLRSAGIAVDQIELEPARGLSAEAVLSATLRQDIDVLSVGELRTPAEAQLALQASHTGRLVLAGVHAGSAEEARQRMLDLGVDPVLLTAALRGTLWQRLQTVACDCRASLPHESGHPDPSFSQPCPTCRSSGRTRRLHAQFLPGKAER